MREGARDTDYKILLDKQEGAMEVGTVRLALAKDTHGRMVGHLEHRDGHVIATSGSKCSKIMTTTLAL